ncbi:DUF6520 family protein [Mucilaginibacter sp. FT3.2]|uniref:DUF6520 family protein n=1 Tax=Mucilaginibacter sp. FT3.2 TaxID=2723090 RepID=UPI00161FB919|nr:DUF6520 family protein [Mucilaginibacter sp. FT3.2]MBB6234200.1 hypothetical protein [Mucilaginibacter sp. FT3.2]
MKNSKAAIFALAFVLGIGGAFSTHAAKASHKPAAVWWKFNGLQTQITDPAQYTFSSLEPTCSAGSDRCAVEANRSTANPAQPDLSTITHEDLKP